MIPVSDFVQGFMIGWPYIAGAAGIAAIIGLAIPVKKKEKENTIVREEIKDNVKIVTKVHRKEVTIDYDVFMKMIADYEKVKQEAQKEMLTQLALLEAKKEQEKDIQLRDSNKPEDAYKDLVKVKKTNGNGKMKRQDEDEEDEVDTSEIYKE